MALLHEFKNYQLLDVQGIQKVLVNNFRSTYWALMNFFQTKNSFTQETSQNHNPIFSPSEDTSLSSALVYSGSK